MIEWNFLPYLDAPENYEPDWLIEGMLQADGLNIITGEPKAFKSMLRRYLHACLVTGQPAFGLLPVKKRPKKMLVLLAEDHPGAERFVMDTILREMQWEGDYPIVFSEPEGLWLEKPKHVQEMADMLEGEGFDYFSIDPMIEFHGQDENSSADMSKVTKSLHKLKKVATPLLIHHTGRSQDGQRRSVIDSSRGSSVVPGAANCLVNLTRFGGVRHQIRRRTKSADDSDDWSVTLNADTWVWRMDEPFTRDAVLKVVQQYPKLTAKEYAHHMSRNVAAVLAKLKELVDLETIKVTPNGKRKEYEAF